MSDKTKTALQNGDQAIADRRSFMKLAGAGLVTAGATVVAAVPAAAEPCCPDSDKTGHYRETDHVKRYYELARG
jgi:hypothetical protein